MAVQPRLRCQHTVKTGADGKFYMWGLMWPRLLSAEENEFGFLAHPQPDLLPQEKEQRRSVNAFWMIFRQIQSQVF